MFEDLFSVRGIGHFAGEVLPGEVQPFVHVQPPFWAVGYVIYDAIEGDEFTRAALACIAFEFEE